MLWLHVIMEGLALKRQEQPRHVTVLKVLVEIYVKLILITTARADCVVMAVLVLRELDHLVSCLCSARYTGYVTLQICHNGGTCTESESNGVNCICVQGFDGISCEKVVNMEVPLSQTRECETTTCLNGGVRTQNLNSTCICPQHWTGDVCQDCTLSSCSQCLYDLYHNETICSVCLPGFSLTSIDSCGKLYIVISYKNIS